MKLKYTVITEVIDDNPEHAAYAPDVPGCFAKGDSEDEALAEMRKALQAHIERLHENGEPIPEPKTAEMDAYGRHASDLYYRDEDVDAAFDEIEVEIPPGARFS